MISCLNPQLNWLHHQNIYTCTKGTLFKTDKNWVYSSENCFKLLRDSLLTDSGSTALTEAETDFPAGFGVKRVSTAEVVACTGLTVQTVLEESGQFFLPTSLKAFQQWMLWPADFCCAADVLSYARRAPRLLWPDMSLMIFSGTPLLYIQWQL